MVPERRADTSQTSERLPFHEQLCRMIKANPGLTYFQLESEWTLHRVN